MYMLHAAMLDPAAKKRLLNVLPSLPLHCALIFISLISKISVSVGLVRQMKRLSEHLKGGVVLGQEPPTPDNSEEDASRLC